MPADVRWAPCVTGLCLWHEADEHGEAGYRCVATMDESLAGQYAEILNGIALDYDHDRAAYRIAHGWVTPTREVVEDAVLRSIGHYPLEPRPGDVVTSGAVISDFKVKAAEITPRASISDDEMTRLEKLKPNAAAAELRKLLDALAAQIRSYDEIRSTGKKPFDPNYPPSLPSGHQNLLQSLQLMTNQISYSKAKIGALLNLKPFLAGDLTISDRDLLTVPDAEEEDEGEEDAPLEDMVTSVRFSDGESVTFTSGDLKALKDGARHLRALEDAIPAEVDKKIPMSGKALKVILNAASAKPGKNDPALPIHSVGIGSHSICATDQKKAVIVGEVEEEYEATDRTEALVEASSSDLRGEWVRFSDILRLKPAKEGEEPPAYPPIGKIARQLDGMVEVGTFNPSLLKQVAMVAESLGTSKVTLFRASGSGVASMLGFKGEYWPFEQLELFSEIDSPVPFLGILAGTEKRGSSEGEGDE